MGVPEVSFSCCSGSCRERFLSSFLTTVLPRDRWSFRDISSPGLDRSFHWKIISDRRMISEDFVNPQKDNFFLTIIPRKYSLFKAPSSPPWSAQQPWRNTSLHILVAELAQADWAHISIAADKTACPPCALLLGMPEQGLKGKGRALCKGLIYSKRAFLHRIP